MSFLFAASYYSSFDSPNIFFRELWLWNFEKIVISRYLKVLLLLGTFKAWKMCNVILLFNWQVVGPDSWARKKSTRWSVKHLGVLLNLKKIVLLSVAGMVPGPIFFGAIIDGTCLVWQEKCKERASCWIYDNEALSRNFFVILVCVKTLAAIMFILAYKFYNPPADKLPNVSMTVKNHSTENGTGPPRKDNSSVSDSVSERTSTF